MSRFILLAVVLIGTLYGQTTSGTINSDETWFPGDTIVVTDDITVTDGAHGTVYDLRRRVHRADRISTGIYFTVNEESRLITKRLTVPRLR